LIEGKFRSREVIITFAHLPAGYIVSRLLFNSVEQRITSYKRYLFWGLFGAVAPDIDHIYLLLFNPRQPDHHLYFPHYPVFWFSLLFLSWCLLVISKKNEQNSSLFFLFSLEGTTHMILDSVSRHIYWLAPLSSRIFSIEHLIHLRMPWFIERYPYWELSLEASILVWAAYLLITDRNAGKIRARLTARAD
jgi:hypothetical protein